MCVFMSRFADRKKNIIGEMRAVPECVVLVNLKTQHGKTGSLILH